MSRVYPLHTVALLALILTSVRGGFSPLHAEQPIRVYADQYVIEAHETFAADVRSSRSELGALSALAKRELGFNSFLVSARVAAADASIDTFAASPVVPYNASDSFCSDLLKSKAVKSCSPNFEMRTLLT